MGFNSGFKGLKKTHSRGNFGVSKLNCWSLVRYYKHRVDCQKCTGVSKHCDIFIRDVKRLKKDQILDWLSLMMKEPLSSQTWVLIHVNLLTVYSLLVTWCTNKFNFNNCTHFPHSMCFVFISEQTANSAPCNINCPVFYNRDEKCLQRGMDWVFE